MPAPHTPEQKARAVVLLAEGRSNAEVCDELGINRSTLYRWAHEDEEFMAARQALVDKMIDVAVVELRGLVGDSIDALRRGVRSTHKQQVVKLAETYEIVDVADNSLAVATADRVLKKFPEFAESLEIDLGPSEQLAELIRRMDGPSEPAPDGGTRPPAAPGPAGVRASEPQDPDQADRG